LFTFYLSVFDCNMVCSKKEFVRLENYIAVFTDSESYAVLWNTVVYILILMVLNFIVPYVLAFVLQFMIPKFKDFFKSAFFLPSFISMVVGSMIYNWMLNPSSGPVAEISGLMGISIPNWTTLQILVILVMCDITARKVFGYNFITLYAAVASISEEINVNARLDNLPTFGLFLDIV